VNTKRQLEQALLRIKELSHALDIRRTIIDAQEANYLKLQKSYYEASAEVTALKQTIRARELRLDLVSEQRPPCNPYAIDRRNTRKPSNKRGL